MLNRREFLGASGALFSVAASGRVFAQAARGAGDAAIGAAGHAFLRGSPINFRPDVTSSAMFDGLPFWTGFSGDRFQGAGHPPFPALGEWIGYGNPPPEPSSTEDIVIVGGGLAGLTTAYLLRDRKPLLLEHNSRFGGNAQGEVWQGLPFSLGSAYFIEPDEPLTSFYKELGLDRLARVTIGTPGPDPVEVSGSLVDGFWTGDWRPSRAERDYFQRYLALVEHVSKNEYPDIPLPKKGYEWILEWDARSFKQDVETRLGGPAPALLEAGIQQYFYSSFNAGWEQVSAAAGWNFVAAELYGLWVLPGGVPTMTQAIWLRLLASLGRDRMRTETVVLDVRPYQGDALVTYGKTDGTVHSIRARRVVMACPKFVCRHTMDEYFKHEPERLNSTLQLNYNPYIVANVLLDAGMPEDFYDLFLVEDGSLPDPPHVTWEQWHRPVDALNANFALHGSPNRSVLTFYWPLPWIQGRAFVGLDLDPLPRIAPWCAPHIRVALDALKIPHAAVRQVRLTRWGHAMPVAAPRLLTDGHAQRVREPTADGRVFFINQDNWGLPAVETALLEAFEWAPRVVEGL